MLDGYPAEQAIGCDVLPGFLELGHQLWRDKETSPIKFIADNVFNIPDPTQLSSKNLDVPPSDIKGLEDLTGRVRFLYTHSVFHLFNQEKQAEMALKLATLSSRTPGSIIFGGHIGAEMMGFTSGPLTVYDTRNAFFGRTR